MSNNTPETSRRCRTRPCPVAGISITPRKVRIIVAAFLNRVARGENFDALFASVKTRNECLRLMFDHGYLNRSFPAASCFGAPVYHVGRAGVPVAVSALSKAGIELSSEDVKALSRRPALTQLDHALRASDVYAACCLCADDSAGVRVDRFLPEHLVRFDYEIRRPDTQKWQERRFAPDGAMVVSVGDAGSGLVALFLEIDLGTVDLLRFAKKCQAFTHVSAAGLSVGRTGAEYAALAIVTTSEPRLARLRAVAEKQRCSPVLLTTFGEMERSGLSATWARAGSDGRVTIKEFLLEQGGSPCTA